MLSLALGLLAASGARAEVGAIEPFAPGMSRELRIARSLAFSRLRHGPRCRALFEAVGADGALLLERASFRMATATERTRICRPRRAALFTKVRGTEIVVCPAEFDKLASEDRAALLLHEALHHAGVSERPLDERALSSTQLTRLVEKRCYL